MTIVTMKKAGYVIECVDLSLQMANTTTEIVDEEE